jgi:peptidyl-prolyl cis-trans isomerase B (cyclophilin B)
MKAPMLQTLQTLQALQMQKDTIISTNRHCHIAKRVGLLTSSAIILMLSVFVSHAAMAADAMPQVRMQTNMGDITIELNQEKAPISVENFLSYVNDGFYTGTVFHRVIDGFMIQGGGFTENLQRKETRAPIQNEANNGLKNDKYTVAMARTNEPHSATAQFFINVVNNDFLNYRSSTASGWGYTVFGKVIAGMDVVDKIRKVQTGPSGPFRKDVPRAPVIIEAVTVIPAAE